MGDPERTANLRAGVAVYNAGHHHAAHDAWEEQWLELETGTDEEMFLHGLIQFTAAVHHAHRANWPGVTGLANSAREYLADLATDYHGINVGELRTWLEALERDPELIEREGAPQLTHNGRPLGLDDLEFPAAGIAATVIAEASGYDEPTIARAVEYASQELAAGRPTSPFVSLVFDFVQSPSDREIIVQRLGEHIDRRKGRENDVEGLFDE